MAQIIQNHIHVDHKRSALLTIENALAETEPPTYRVTLDCYRERTKVVTEFQGPLDTRMDLIAAAWVAIAAQVRKEGVLI